MRDLGPLSTRLPAALHFVLGCPYPVISPTYHVTECRTTERGRGRVSRTSRKRDRGEGWCVFTYKPCKAGKLKTPPLDSDIRLLHCLPSTKKTGCERADGGLRVKNRGVPASRLSQASKGTKLKNTCSDRHTPLQI